MPVFPKLWNWLQIRRMAFVFGALGLAEGRKEKPQAEASEAPEPQPQRAASISREASELLTSSHCMCLPFSSFFSNLRSPNWTVRRYSEIGVSFSQLKV